MIKSSRFNKAIELFDEANGEDPNFEEYNGLKYPKELLYAKRMTDKLNEFDSSADEALQLAVRCQHLRRWEIPREDFEMNRVGYLQWRNRLKSFHAEGAAQILEEAGYGKETIDRVKFLLLKKQLKKDQVTQTLEDVICLVFLEFYFEKFSFKYKEDKLIDILRKTWRKMSDKGQKGALELNFSDRSLNLIEKALDN